MAAPSSAELSRLSGVLPELRMKHDELRRRAEAEGIEFVVPAYGGLRTEADQAQLVAWRDQAVAKGLPWYPVAPFGSSFHERGAAFDVKVTKGSLDRLGVLGESLGLRWGGRWTKADPFHFELPTTLQKAKDAFLAFAGRRGVQLGALFVGAAIFWFVFDPFGQRGGNPIRFPKLA